jgi:DNA helicase HerA-like ATPase
MTAAMHDDDIPIGTVKGPGTASHEYRFITTDNHLTKIGEFVTYTVTLDGMPCPILGKITERQLLRALPDAFLADPTVAPRDVAALLGEDLGAAELFEVTVAIAGRFDPELKGFLNPRIPPDPGAQVHVASHAFLTRVLSPKAIGTAGSAHLGSLLTRAPGEVPIVLDVKHMVSTHLAILASTGSGKSYTAGVLIEELMKPTNRAAVLVVDPHGEYGTLSALETHPAFAQDGYRPRVKVIPHERVKIRLSSLTEADIKALLPMMSEKMTAFIGKAFDRLKRRDTHLWGIGDLLAALDSLRAEGAEDDPASNASTIEGLRWRLEDRFARSTVFDDKDHIPLPELFTPGQVTVLQLNEVDVVEQQIIVATIARRINRARMDTKTGKVLDGEAFIPYPVFMLLEEAHRFAPAGAAVVSTPILKTILAEGRKFGVGVGLITQRPGKLDADVLSQCMTQFIMRIVNPIDQQTIAQSVEGASRDLLSELPALTRGQVVVSGVAVNTPLLCQVRARHTAHGGETIDAPAEWLDYFGLSRSSARTQDAAILAAPPAAKRYDGYSI